MYYSLKTVATLFLCVVITISAVAQQAATLEVQARQSTDRRESMNLYYKAAEKYLATNPVKASSMAHQAYLIAKEELRDNVMAARAAYLNGESYLRQSKYGDAKLRYTRGKESSLELKDYDFAAKCLDKMSIMAQSEGNTNEANQFKQEAKNYRTVKPTPPTTATAPVKPPVKPVTTPAVAQQSTPTRTTAPQPQLPSDREKYRQYQRDSMEWAKAVALQKEKLKELAQQEQQLTVKKQEVEQVVAQKDFQLASVTLQKDELDRINIRKQQLVEALQSGKSLDSIAYEQDRQYQELKLQKSQSFRNVLLLILGFTILFVSFFYRRFIENQKQKHILEQKNRQIEDEKQRSDELLLNILPTAIAEELKNGGKAKARKYEQASVLFVDFKNFTKISEQLSPEDLVAELDHYFKAFDFIIGQYKLEKIKTIGDAYMVASGLSDRITSPVSIVRAALEMQEFLSDMKAEKQPQNKPFFEARMGIHTGPVVAGVVGIKKFAYDIWGDTVNIAARLQDASDPACINVSEAVYNEVRYTFRCHYRGKFPAKNKGNIDMYYIDGLLK